MLPTANLDPLIAHWFRNHLSPLLANLFETLSNPGCALCITLLLTSILILLAWRRHWFAALILILAVPGGTLLSELLKLLIQRPRPFLTGPDGLWGGYSFPSGHTIAATLLYSFLAALASSALSARGLHRWRWLPPLLAALLILSVGLSRIALGAHYFSDVLAAILLGLAWLTLCWLAVRLLRRHLRPTLPTP